MNTFCIRASPKFQQPELLQVAWAGGAVRVVNVDTPPRSASASRVSMRIFCIRTSRRFSAVWVAAGHSRTGLDEGDCCRTAYQGHGEQCQEKSLTHDTLLLFFCEVSRRLIYQGEIRDTCSLGDTPFTFLMPKNTDELPRGDYIAVSRV
jgi:hypothetical protein